MEFTSEIHLVGDVELGQRLFAATKRSQSLASQIKSTSRTNIEHLRLIYREAIIVILPRVPQFFHFCIMCSTECFLFYRPDWISAFNRARCQRIRTIPFVIRQTLAHMCCQLNFAWHAFVPKVSFTIQLGSSPFTFVFRLSGREEHVADVLSCFEQFVHFPHGEEHQDEVKANNRWKNCSIGDRN